MRELLVEVVRGGTEIDYYYIALPGDPSAPLDLFLIRRKGRVTCLFSYDGRSLLAFRDFSLDYPAKIKIGLTASNLSRKPFTARFSDFVLLDDKLKLEAGVWRVIYDALTRCIGLAATRRSNQLATA